jgi:hypothetical protein
MKSPEPPRFARLLLERLGPQNEPLCGDLLEEYRAGRSRWWYWRQALAAVTSGAAGELWRDKSLAFRAIAMAIGIQALIAMLLEPAWEHWLTGWVRALARAVQGADATTSSLMWAHMLAWLPACVCVGWLLARMHPEHRGPVVLSVVVFALLFGAPQLITLISRSLDHPRFLNQLQIHVAGTMTYVGGVLCGAVMSAPQRRAEIQSDLRRR